jgi:hypothetical protein
MTRPIQAAGIDPSLAAFTLWGIRHIRFAGQKFVFSVVMRGTVG